MVPMSGTTAPTALEQRFAGLAAGWKVKRAHQSSARKMALIPEYQEVIRLGEAVVPLLLAQLRREPDHWFVALQAITGADPVPEESRGNVKAMAAAWVRWGQERGILADRQ